MLATTILHIKLNSLFVVIEQKEIKSLQKDCPWKDKCHLQATDNKMDHNAYIGRVLVGMNMEEIELREVK